MHLKQEDRDLLRKFFFAELDWMRKNSLLNPENLNEFKRRFVDFTELNNCKENEACKMFESTLDQEILRCGKSEKVESHEVKSGKGIKRVKLKYMPAVQPETDNRIILAWLKKARIAAVVSAEDMEALNRSIKQKVKQNEDERRAGNEQAKNFVVR